MTNDQRRAVVIGAGIAGLSAAMALTETFDSVTVVERDTHLMTPDARRGVPQGRQPHLLLSGGMTALATLFPAIDDDLVAAGAIPYAAGWTLRSEVPGLGAFPKRHLGLESLAMTRPVLEATLLHRLLYETHARISPRTRAVAIETSPDGARVTGIALAGDGDGWVEPADVVVDASGQAAAPTLACLARNGWPAPRTTTVQVDIGYTSALFTLPAGTLDIVAVLTHADAPASGRAGYLLRLSDELWQVCLVGRGADQPPESTADLLAYAETLATPTIADALRRGTPPEAPARFRLPASVRRHYDGAAMPAGLVPLGDAICRLNPIYGQGMTVAAQQAVLLRDLMARPGDPVPTLTADFVAGAEPLVERAWQLSVVPDFAYPETVGDRPDDLGARLDAMRRRFAAAMTDPDAHRTLVRALHLVGPAAGAPDAGPDLASERRTSLAAAT